MIASFFQHLDTQRVEWLLISGQATILYGAATFSKDIDLWVKPDLEWARDHMFTLAEFTRWIAEYPVVVRVLQPGSTLRRAAEQLQERGESCERRWTFRAFRACSSAEYLR